MRCIRVAREIAAKIKGSNLAAGALKEDGERLTRPFKTYRRQNSPKCLKLMVSEAKPL